MSDINLELYKTFVLVAREKSINKASRKTYISQPAITQSIKKLEKQLDVKLFKRKNNGVELTDEGRNIYDNIKDAVDVLENIGNQYGKKKNINIGCNNMTEKICIKNLVTYMSDHPNISMNFVHNNMFKLLSKLEKNELDIVISKKNDNKNKNIVFKKLGNVHDILITSQKSKFYMENISKERLKECVVCLPFKDSITTMSFFRDLNLKESDFNVIRYMDYTSILKLVEETDNSIGVVTKEYFAKELKEGNFIELKSDFDLNFSDFGFYLSKNNNKKEIKELCKALETIKMN